VFSDSSIPFIPIQCPIFPQGTLPTYSLSQAVKCTCSKNEDKISWAYSLFKGFQIPAMNPSSLNPKIHLLTVLAAVFFLIAIPLSALQNPPSGGCFVYPSPATGNLAWVVYNLPESGSAAIYIYDEAGDLITSEQAPNYTGIQQTPIDLTHYQNGIYICRVILTLDSGATQALKLFKFIVSK
jgi:hypothetical protein